MGVHERVNKVVLVTLMLLMVPRQLHFITFTNEDGYSKKVVKVMQNELHNLLAHRKVWQL